MRGAAIAAASVAVAGLVAVSIVVLRDSDPPEAQPGVHGVGTEIGDGFVVAPGSELLGTRFPQPGPTYPTWPQRGWDALLTVTGDPIEVFNAYRDQATRMTGHPLPSALDACEREVLPPEPTSIQPLALDDSVPAGWQVLAIVCEAYGRTAGSEPSGTTIGLALWYTEAKSADPYASHLELRFASWGDGPPAALPRGSSSTTETASSQPGNARDVGPRQQEPDLPTEGQPLDRRRKPSADRANVTIEPGSELIAPTAPVVCTTGGYQAVLRITGDLEQVMTGYARQLSTDFLLPEPDVVEGRDDGLDVIEVRPDASGFGDLWAIAVVVDSETAYLHIERCND